MKRQKDLTLKDELLTVVGAQYATGDQRRNNSRKNELTEPKGKQHPVVNVTSDGSKVWCCKEQYCIGTWNVSSMNQSKLLLLLLSHFSSVWLCDPMDDSPPVSSVPGILQARTLEWVAISFSSAWKWKVKVNSLSHVWLLATPWTAAYQAPPSMGFSRQEYWSGVPLPSLKRRLSLSFTHTYT